MAKTEYLPSGLVAGDIDWLVQMLMPDGMGSEGLSTQGQRIVELLREHENDFRLDSPEREQKLKDQWEAWSREAQNRHCIVCSEIQWTQDMSGKNNVICMGCGRPLCITHYLVHKALEEATYPTPEQQQAAARVACDRRYGVPHWRDLSISQRAALSLEVKLPSSTRFGNGRHTYTVYVDEYEQHWRHRCRTPIPPKNLRVLRAEQAALHQALVEVDKEMETAPPDPED